MTSDAPVEVQFFNDYAAQTTTGVVTQDLAQLFAYSDRWARHADRDDHCTLTFSSMLAAMMAGTNPLCRWLQRHLGLRGIAAATMTGKLSFAPATPIGPLTTSESFRTAWAAACRLRGDDNPRQPVDVRHFMAAYAVCRNYHLLDFLRLRIDRRSWCLELAAHLRAKHQDEDLRWRAYATLAPPIPLPEFNSDAPQGRDLLNIGREVEAFSHLIAARTTYTPLSVGVFGAWGSGKSFFMQRVRDRVAHLGEIGAEHAGGAYHDRIAQIEFNAWHYSEGSLIASLVEHIFGNLRIGVADEDEETLRRRSDELIAQLARAEQSLTDREQHAEDARDKRLIAERRLADIEERLPDEVRAGRRQVAAAEAAAVEVQAALAEVQERRRAKIREAAAGAPIRVAAQALLAGITGPDVITTERAIRELVGETKSVTARWKPIALGLVVLAIGLLASTIVQTEIYAQVVSAIAALGTAVAAASAWMRKLNVIAEKGEEFQRAQKAAGTAAAAAVDDEYRAEMTALTDELNAWQDVARKAAEGLTAVVDARSSAADGLHEIVQEHRAAIEQYAQASIEVAAKQEARRALGHQGLLSEFLDERAATDGYRKNLTLFSQVRNDFERLSKLMTRAAAEHATDHRKPLPTVGRIVLYIDDLDRCPEDKVIEVLRTVHLLLAFPLFVCVVAVDPRWVNRCLRNAPGLLGSEYAHEPTGDATGSSVAARRLDETFGTPATPADYLEKIFQIPLWLRPVPAAQRPEIVRALFTPDPPRSELRAVTPAITVHGPATAADRDRDDRAVEAMADTIRPVPRVAAAGIDDQADGASVRPPAEAAIDDVELQYLDELGGLLDGNPRALKRFVNTYRLVKLSLSDVELDVFRSQVGMSNGHSHARYLPYRVCMAQLAVLCTQRERALRMVRLADDRPDSLGAWLDQIAVEDPELAQLFRRVLPPDSPDPSSIGFDTFALWLERTRRYSFYV